MSPRFVPLLVVLSFVTARGDAPRPVFPGQFIPGNYPYYIRAMEFADLDGDGDVDLATVGGYLAGVFLNNGLGLFTGSSPIELNYYSGAIGTGDFNADGHVDLIFVQERPYRLVPYLNDGHASFAPITGVELGGWSRKLAVADINADGNSDVAAFLATEQLIKIFLSDGAGGFDEGPIFSASEETTDIVFADLDGDVLPEFIVTNTETDSVAVYHNLGNASFDPPALYPAFAGPLAVAAGDVNNDGLIDLAVANQTTLHNALSVFYNQGNGQFGPRADFDGIRLAVDVALADIDADGALDALLLSESGHKTAVLRNDGIGGFVESQSLFAGFSPTQLVVIDAENDGWPDVATLISGDVPFPTAEGVGIAHNHGGSLAASTVYQASGTMYEAVAAEFNGDGVLDFATADYTADSVSEFSGSIHGTFSYDSLVTISTGPYSIDAADIDGDNDTDLACANFDPYGGDVISILKNDGTGTFALSQELLFQDAVCVRFGDFDQDGDVELLACGRSTPPTLYETSGSGGYFGAVELADVGVSFLRVADLNGDHWPDFIGGHDFMYVFLNLHDGSFSVGPPLPIADFELPGLCVADLDGDGDLDVAACQPDWSVGLYENPGDGTFQPNAQTIYPIDSLSTLIAVDVDQNSLPDLARLARSGGYVTVYVNRGGFQFEERGRYLAGAMMTAGLSWDMNHDGAGDLLTLDWARGEFSVLFNQLGLPGDMNCDGVVDLFDIDAFVLALASRNEWPLYGSYYAAHPDCRPWRADIDGDGDVTLFDVAPFVTLITNAP